jgi:ABC-type multidrug transport system fused ATPase/permease subunit
MNVTFKETLKIAKSVFKKCWEVSRKNSLTLIITLIFTSSVPYLIAYILNLIINQISFKTGSLGLNLQRIFQLIFFLIFLRYLLEVFTGLQDFSKNKLKLYLEKEYSRLVNSKLLQLPVWKFEDTEFSDFISRVKSSYAYRPVQHFIDSINFIRNIIEIIIAVFILSTFNISWVVFLFVSSLPNLFLSLNLAKEQYKVWIKNAELYRKYGHIEWMFTFKPAVTEIRSYTAENFFIGKIMGLLDLVKINSEKIFKKKFHYSIIVNVLPYLVAFFILIKTSSLVISGVIGVGVFTLYFITLQRMLDSLNSGVSGLSGIFESTFFVKEVDSFLDMEIPEESNNKNKEISLKPNIEFKNVSFKYPLTEKLVLKNINLRINFGERLALVGENGAGKSTIVGLLLKFYEPTEGAILADGINLKDIDSRTWYKIISPMFQTLTNYNLTVEDFITLGAKVDYEKLEKVSKLTNCFNMIEGFENKFKQQLGRYYSNGEELSGGQWQRLTLARALYKESAILILDEPTSSLDPKAEVEIFENLSEYEKNKTVFFVSHRFTTIRKADRIIFLENGEIKGDGTHEELMVSNTAYKTIFEEQAKSFKS